MDASTQRQLNVINRNFYAQQATAFAETRDHPWPGWNRAWQHVDIKERLRLLDMGCGAGRFARFLGEQTGATRIDYIGIDASVALLERARGESGGLASADFRCADWVENSPEECLPDGAFDYVALLGVLHHVPGHAQRCALLRTLSERLSPGGALVVTAWRFAAEDIKARFQERIVSWEEWNQNNNSVLDLSQLESGDFLLRWGSGKELVRYCHYADEQEVARWLRDLPAEVVDEFQEDGRGRNLNHYVVLRRR